MITRDGEPAGVLIGFTWDEGWANYCLERDPRFLRRIRKPRPAFVKGAGSSSKTSNLNSLVAALSIHGVVIR